MNNTRIARLEDSLQQEIENESLNIVLGSINYKENTMILCIDGFSGSTIDEGNQFIDDHPENHYYIFGDHSNAPEKPDTGTIFGLHNICSTKASTFPSN